MPIPSTSASPTRSVVADALFDRLLAAIVSGEMPPDERLSDNSVAAWAGVSRTPAREALDRLARLHLVIVRRRRGTFVAPLDHIRYADTLEALGPVIEEMTRLVVRAGPDRDRRALAKAATSATDTPALFDVGGPFEIATRLVRNDRVRRTWNDLVPHLQRTWNLEPAETPAGLTEDEQARLAVAARDSDADTAAAIIRDWFAPHIVDRSPTPEPDADVDVDEPEDNPQEIALQESVADKPTVEIPAPTVLQNHAFDTLYGALLDGTLVPGEELNESALQRWLDMSRQPIRHALVRLSEYGLVDMTPNRHPRVAPLDPGRTNRTRVLSVTWNLFTVEHTVGTLPEDALDELEDATAEFVATADGSDFAANGRALQRIFAVFTNALGNAVISEQTTAHPFELSGMLRPGGSLVNPASLAEPLQRLQHAAASEDVDEATAVMRTLLDGTLDNFVEHFRQ